MLGVAFRISEGLQLKRPASSFSGPVASKSISYPPTFVEQSRKEGPSGTATSRHQTHDVASASGGAAVCGCGKRNTRPCPAHCAKYSKEYLDAVRSILASLSHLSPARGLRNESSYLMSTYTRRWSRGNATSPARSLSDGGQKTPALFIFMWAAGRA